MNRGIAYGVVGAIIAFGLYVLLFKHGHKVDRQIASTALGAHEVEKVVINPAKHTITFAVRSTAGTTLQSSYLPSHVAAIVVDDKGAIRFEARKYGAELSPFAGFALGSDIKARAALGVNLFFVQRWEMGGGLLLSNEVRDTRIFAGVSYNAYSNCSVGLAVDNRKTVHLLASLRF